jgi:hypothetical protein
MTMEPVRVLLQTTIPFNEDDWSVERFSMLADYISRLRGPSGESVEVTARNRDAGPGPDSVLSTLADSPFDQVWLFAVDSGSGLTEEDCAGLTAFRRAGGGLLVTRDHENLGSSVCTIGGVGAAHFFHDRNPEPDPERHARDDQSSPDIGWPNYHSGANGDVQRMEVIAPLHPLLKDPASGRVLELFPAHPHEGAVGAPDDDDSARVIATGTSETTGRTFNLLVAFEQSRDGGRAIAESSFHHLVDYNWDPRKGAPSFVDDEPSDAVVREPGKLDDVKAYVRNAVFWLTGA